MIMKSKKKNDNRDRHMNVYGIHGRIQYLNTNVSWLRKKRMGSTRKNKKDFRLIIEIETWQTWQTITIMMSKYQTTFEQLEYI